MKKQLISFFCFFTMTVGILWWKPAVFISVQAKEAAGEAADEWVRSSGTVRIISGDWRGSGVVIARGEDSLIIVSAKHLLMHGVSAQVTFPWTEEADDVIGEVIGYSASYDLAYLRVPFSALQDVKTSFQDVKTSFQDVLQNGIVTADAYRELRAGDWIMQAGLSDTAEPEYYVGTVQAKEVYVSDYNAYMLLNACNAVQGMSGGGAYDTRGRLVGIIVAGDEQGTLCMPMTAVLEEYESFQKEYTH